MARGGQDVARAVMVVHELVVHHLGVTELQELRALRRALLADLPVKPRVYWCDFLASACLAWGASAVLVGAPLGNHTVLVFPLAVVALLRATYFIHELAHQRRTLWAFELVWNFVIGCWVAMPSFMADPHDDHHRHATYGTENDPEYEPVAGWSRTRIVASIALMTVVPPLLAFRFAVLAPLSWIIPSLRRLVWSRMSSLQTNVAYVRHERGRSSPRALGLEALATLAIGSGVVASAMFTPRIAIVWWAVAASALIVNQARTLTAHGYVTLDRPRSLAEQVADSRSARGPHWLTELVYPVGTRYHAIHHLAPTLPYHALPTADRRARALATPSLSAGAHIGLVDGLAALWRRASTVRPHCTMHDAMKR